MPRDWTAPESVALIRSWLPGGVPDEEWCSEPVLAANALATALTESRGEVEAQREKVRSISNLYANERDEAEELRGLLGRARGCVSHYGEIGGALLTDIDAALARRK